MTCQPNYADRFVCLASRCPDTCCAGWEIVIDPATQARYRALPYSWGERLRRAMTVDEDGDVIFKPHQRRCPFLNARNLCDIRLALGRDLTSEICREHPRFTEEYDGFTEYSLSLSCPAVCELVFSQPADAAYPPITANSPDEVLNILVQSRNRFFERFRENGSAAENGNELFRLSFNAQRQIAAEIDAPVWTEIALPQQDDIERFCDALRSDCEILTDAWRALLTKKTDRVSLEELLSFADAHRLTVNRALAYFVYRYFLKSVNHLDCRATASFIWLSTLVPCLLARQCSTPPEEVYRLFSKEIEHDMVNLDILWDRLGVADVT